MRISLLVGLYFVYLALVLFRTSNDTIAGKSNLSSYNEGSIFHVEWDLSYFDYYFL